MKATPEQAEQLDQQFDFDLPEIPPSKPAKPRIYFAGDSVCVACEG